MILVLIVLWSLCAVYFTHLLSNKRMKAAALSVAVLYIYIIAWTYAVFILDVADLGFSETETRLSLLHGSDIYHSFVNITERMSSIPFELLEAIVAVAGVVLLAGLLVAFHGLFQIAKAVVKISKGKRLFASDRSIHNNFQRTVLLLKSEEIFRVNCRMNC